VDARRLYQFQNVGAITNRGFELDAGARRGRFSAAGRLNLVKSRVAVLSPNYTGDFEPGDAPLEVPASMASMALRHEHGVARLEVGATWIGPWTGYDWRLIQRVEAGESPLGDRVREYWMEYDGVLRPFAGVTLALSRTTTLGLRAEWPLEQDALLRDNLTPTVGRTITVGLRYGPTGDPAPPDAPGPPRR
jgi:iron complex outermembrane receptor protein